MIDPPCESVGEEWGALQMACPEKDNGKNVTNAIAARPDSQVVIAHLQEWRRCHSVLVDQRSFHRPERGPRKTCSDVLSSGGTERRFPRHRYSVTDD